MEEIARNKTTGVEWGVIAAIAIIVVLLIVAMYLVLTPKLFGGSTAIVPTPPNLRNPAICPTSDPPTGLSANQVTPSEPSVDVSWDAVLGANTAGEKVLGYNIYLSETSGITEANKVLRIFTQVPYKRLLNLEPGTQYYYKVATVDSCGVGVLSTEEGSFLTAP